MKGGYNNGTNSSAAPILAYTALSQARINDSNYTTKNRSSKSEYFKAGDIDFERGYNASVNSTGITSKGQGMPRFRKSIDVHNASDKGYALAGAREGSFQSSDNKTGEYFIIMALAGVHLMLADQKISLKLKEIKKNMVMMILIARMMKLFMVAALIAILMRECLAQIPLACSPARI